MIHRRNPSAMVRRSSPTDCLRVKKGEVVSYARRERKIDVINSVNDWSRSRRRNHGRRISVGDPKTDPEAAAPPNRHGIPELHSSHMTSCHLTLAQEKVLGEPGRSDAEGREACSNAWVAATRQFPRSRGQQQRVADPPRARHGPRSPAVRRSPPRADPRCQRSARRMSSPPAYHRCVTHDSAPGRWRTGVVFHGPRGSSETPWKDTFREAASERAQLVPFQDSAPLIPLPEGNATERQVCSPVCPCRA